MDRGVTVAEVTYCNSISVAEHVVMLILSLVRNYIPSLQDRGRRRLEHRRQRRARVRPGGDAGRDGWRWSHRVSGPAPAEAVRCRPSLHRSLSSARAGAGAGRHLPPERRVARRRVRRRDDQYAAPPRDGAHVQRRDDRQDEARRVPREHSTRQDCRPRRDRPRAWKAADWRATPATSGSPSPHPPITRGARCPGTA